jgi:hypothetical protein
MFAQQSLIGSASNLESPTSPDFIHKSELESFKLELIAKINRRFEMEEQREKHLAALSRQESHVIRSTSIKFGDFEMSQDNFHKDPLEMIPSIDFNKTQAGNRRLQGKNNGGMRGEDSHLSCQSTSLEPVTPSEGEINVDNMLVLKRETTSSQSKGYLFLAVMFGMMCCSSYNVNNNDALPNTHTVP